MTKKLVFKRPKKSNTVLSVDAAKTRQIKEQERLRKWAKGVNVTYPSKKATTQFEKVSDTTRIKLVEIVLKSMALSDSIRRANATMLELGMEDVSLEESTIPRQLNKLIDLKIFLILLEEMDLDVETLAQVKNLYIESKFTKQDGKKTSISPRKEGGFESLLLRELEEIRSKARNK